MSASSKSYQYVHPEEIVETFTHTESGGTQLIFSCPMCEGKASYSTVERIGRCFVCQGIIKLHNKYDSISIEEIFSDLPQQFHISTRKKRDRVEIVTRPLGQQSIDYITSRGIDLEIVQRFGLLEETTYHGGLYLAWQTYAGDYEIRATFPTTKIWRTRTYDGHHKHFTLAKLTPETSTCIVCEGMFSAMAYAQLFNRYDAWYAILNSVSNKEKFIGELPTLTAAGITDVILALDNDQAGIETGTFLEQLFQEAGLHLTIHCPEHDGDDWNDVLLRGPAPVTQEPTLEADVSDDVVSDSHVLNEDVFQSKVDSKTVAVISLQDVEPSWDTVESLSRADQDITADYYDRVLATYAKSVIAAPCGTGKTHAAAEYIARRWQDGVLYVAERTEQIKAMQQHLTTQYGVPEERIGTYYNQSPDLKALNTSETSKPIALITQARMQIFAPQAYTLFHRHGKFQNRQLMIVDESLPALVIMSVPMLVVEAFLNRMGLTWEDTGKLDPDDIDSRIYSIEEVIDQHSTQPLKRIGINYLEWTNYLNSSQTSIGIRRHAYYLMLYQILSGTYLRRDDAIDVLIPMAPHMTWQKLFDQILTLDATAHITDYLYSDYTILTPGTWNYQDIVEGYTVRSSLGNLTKTNAGKHRETLLTELHDHLAPLLADQAFDDPYVVTYKTLNGDSFVKDVQTVLGVSQVQNYGGTRGSNTFRTKSSAVLLGAYRPPVEFDRLAYLLFGRPSYSPQKYAVAHWVQEMYRTRIRNQKGESIKLLVAGEEDIVKMLKAYTGLRLSSMSIGQHDHLDWVERVQKQIKTRTQDALFRQLTSTRQVEKKAFANEHTDRSVAKVERALSGLLKTEPSLQDHIRTDETHIYLVDKPAPTR